MSMVKIIPVMELNNRMDLEENKAISIVKSYDYGGADEILIYHCSKGDIKEKKALWSEFLSLAKSISRSIDIPFNISAYIDNLEDVKLAIYTGAKSITLNWDGGSKKELIKEAAERFGSEKIMISIDLNEEINFDLSFKEYCNELLIKNYKSSPEFIEEIADNSISYIIEENSKIINEIDKTSNKVYEAAKGFAFYGLNKNIMDIKLLLKSKDIETNTFESQMTFSEFKLDTDKLIPVITQDYKTGEVLMLAYMNEESYNRTISTGIMTYYSRSRKELWIKGESSGHYQYPKELLIDCDSDTILAKVVQTGAACHTGTYSCFSKNLMKKEYNKNNPLKILEKVYDTIILRKNEPKEGSYTNYLIDEGIDKILKKCGEEATEIIIAAKNPDDDELRYEIADFLYHLMVLMVESNLEWEDIMDELSNRN